ncbi:MAG: hypothetical protein RLZZ185_424, partial [Bacteroidota bacterium]
MFSILSKTVTKIFGTKSERDIKAIMPIVEKIKEEYARLHELSDDALRAKSYEFKQRIQDFLADIDTQISSLREQGNA